MYIDNLCVPSKHMQWKKYCSVSYVKYWLSSLGNAVTHSFIKLICVLYCSKEYVTYTMTDSIVVGGNLALPRENDHTDHTDQVRDSDSLVTAQRLSAETNIAIRLRPKCSFCLTSFSFLFSHLSTKSEYVTLSYFKNVRHLDCSF